MVSLKNVLVRVTASFFFPQSLFFLGHTLQDPAAETESSGDTRSNNAMYSDLICQGI